MLERRCCGTDINETAVSRECKLKRTLLEMSDFEEIDELLRQLDEIQESVTRREKGEVDCFLNKLQNQLNRFFVNEQFLRNCHFTVVGSAAEKTAVRDGTDFDVIMDLPKPFTMDYLEVVDVSEDGVIGVYKLGRLHDKNPNCGYSKILKNYTNQNGYLIVEDLKEAVFDELKFAIKKIAKAERNVSYEYNIKASSFCITIQPKYSSPLKIDLIPQIKASQTDFPDNWNDDVPNIVRKYLSNHTWHARFNLSYPFWMDEENYEHLAVYATFSQLEQYCMKASKNVRNAVRLTKAVSKYYGWVEFGLHSFHIKRTAIALYDTLKGMDPWFGFQAILSELKSQLQEYVIWGVFLEDNDISLEDEKTCRKLAKKINMVKHDICPTNILEKLSEYS